MTYFRIEPYRLAEGWVFDDKATGLREEGLVKGADMLVDRALTLLGAPEGARLIVEFSDEPLDDALITLNMVRPGEDFEMGTWYHCPEFDQEAWLCESLGLYFNQPPARLFIKAHLA